MKIACLFDGAGLARLGLEQAGHDVTGFELDPWKHHLGKFVGKGQSVLSDATAVDLSSFDAVWASPPCQLRSSARTQGDPVSQYAKDYLEWCLNLTHDPLWVENIMSQRPSDNTWGTQFNAAQFTQEPLQNRNRMVGGRYRSPKVYRAWRKWYSNDICPCITATEWKGCGSDARRASRFYGRRLTLDEMAYHMGLTIPPEWITPPTEWNGTQKQWERNVCEAIGNGVPVYMAKAFGECYSSSSS